MSAMRVLASGEIEDILKNKLKDNGNELVNSELREYIESQLAELDGNLGTVLEKKLAKYDKRKRQQIISLLGNFDKKETWVLIYEMISSLEKIPRDDVSREELRETLIMQVEVLKEQVNFSQQPANVQMFYLERKIKSLFLTNAEMVERENSVIEKISKIMDMLFIELENYYKIEEGDKLKKEFMTNFKEYYQLKQVEESDSYLVEEARKNLEIEINYSSLNDFSKEEFEYNFSEAKDLIEWAYSQGKIVDKMYQLLKNQLENLKAGNMAIVCSQEGRHKESNDFAKEYYGDIDDWLVKEAQNIFTQMTNPHQKENSEIYEKLKNINLNAEQTKTIFEIIAKYYGLEEVVNVIILNDQKNIEITRDTIKIPADIQKPASNMGVFAHEFAGGHFFRNVNKEISNFECVSSQYLIDEEGLANYTENKVDSAIKGVENPKSLPYYVLGMDFIKWGANILTGESQTEVHDFYDTFEYILELRKKVLAVEDDNQEVVLDKAIKGAWGTTTRLFRGVPVSQKGRYLPKDKAYLQGVFKISEYLEKDDDWQKLADLYLGKIKTEDIEIYKEIIGQTKWAEYNFYLPDEFVLNNWQELLEKVGVEI